MKYGVYCLMVPTKMIRHVTTSISISLLLLVSTLSYGQLVIQADTISMDCRNTSMFQRSTGTLVFSSQAEFEKADFSARYEEECMPFTDIDFEKHILAGFRYSGSNCHQQIEWSTILKRGDTYVIQFLISPSLCRDMSFRIVWFILDKPQTPAPIILERVNYQQGVH